MKIYNSFTRKKEDFIPIEPNKIRMYVCGQTVYDFCHLGHGRKSVVFDMIRRWFIAVGYDVTYVENITDIDDKIIKRAMENNEDIKQLTSRFINYMHEDFSRLGVLPPDIEPRATEYIPQMVEIIEDLVQKGYAYCADNGDVYYKVRKFTNYGTLSGKTIDDLRVGERVSIDMDKQDPLDFVLWKSAKPGEPYWESSFGKGRPGWHIECSAMSEELLGKNFDIHGGGQDLQFPHHENEIAQSEAHNGCKFANYWMHNGFLNINDEKMSKSLGNFFTLRDVLNIYDPEVIRFFILKTHYRSPLNFSYEAVNEAKHNLNRLYNAIKLSDTSHSYSIDWDNLFAARFKQAMNDDFNTPLAISVLFEMVNEINKQQDGFLSQQLILLANTIGIITSDAKKYFQHGLGTLTVQIIEEFIEKRALAKKNREFAVADQIRNELLSKGIVLEDTPNGTIWRKQ